MKNPFKTQQLRRPTPHASEPQHAHRPDYILLLVVLFLLCFGFIAVLSASSVLSFDRFGNNYYYFKHQLFYGGVIGLAAFAILAKIPYYKLRKYALPFFVIVVILLIVVDVAGTSFGGAQRWIALGPIVFQPSEIAKFGIVLSLAAWFARAGEGAKTFKHGLIPFCIMMGIIAVLLIGQPDVGTLSVVALTSVVVYFTAGAAWAHMGLIIAGGIGSLAYLIHVAPYRAARLTVFLNPDIDPQGIGYQINQALLAIGSGGLFGLGLGQSRQKYNYLPEAASDSIFAIIAEEFGFVRTILLIALFVFLAYRGYSIARNIEDPFGKYLAVGITTWLCFQAFLNIAALTGLIPLTGIPLPFISYGSSALIISLAAAGVLFNISRYTKKSATRSHLVRGSHGKVA